MSADLAEVCATVDAIRPLLAGRSPEVQGAVLADLLATWLLGHIMGGPADTAQLRHDLLDMQIGAVRELINETDSRPALFREGANSWDITYGALRAAVSFMDDAGMTPAEMHEALLKSIASLDKPPLR